MVIRKQDKTQLGRKKERKSRGPLTALKRMVTILRKLNMDHLKVHLTSESVMKMERKWNKIEQMNPMEPRGDEGSVVVLHVY